MSTECKGKDSWPELVGKEGKVAEETIERENPLVNAIIVDEDSPVTRDFRCDRVWVRVNKSGTVHSWPELVGKEGKVGKEIIERENPLVKAVIAHENSAIPWDFRCERVWVSRSGFVVHTPYVEYCKSVDKIFLHHPI